MQTLNALQLISRGMTKVDACKEAGISPWQYDTWIARGSDAIEAYQNAVVEAERIRLSEIVNAQNIILTQLIATVTHPEYSDPDMQLKALKYLDRLQGSLEQKHGVHSKSDKAEDYLLQGPNTRVEESQFSVEHELSKSVVNIKPRQDGSVDVSIPVEKKVIDLLPQLGDDDESATGTEQESDFLS